MNIIAEVYDVLPRNQRGSYFRAKYMRFGDWFREECTSKPRVKGSSTGNREIGLYQVA